jgi:hypothetical protein
MSFLPPTARDTEGHVWGVRLERHVTGKGAGARAALEEESECKTTIPG